MVLEDGELVSGSISVEQEEEPDTPDYLGISLQKCQN